MIRLTVSKYYTPAGRCIQKPYERGKSDEYRKDMLHRYEAGEFSSADSIHFSDAEKYSTRRLGRTVYGGGGIMPDVFVPIDTTGYSNYYRNLTAKGIINRFAISYVDENRKELMKKYPDEERFLREFSVTEEMMDALVRLGERDSVMPDSAQLEISRKTIGTIVKGIIGRDLFDTATYFKVVNPELNPVYVRGLEIINDPEEYRRYLSPVPAE